MSESESAITNRPAAPKRDRHGFRGVPPPPLFDLDELADSTLLTELDVAAILRISSNTVGSWRQQRDHPLQWRALPNGFVRYRVADIRAFLASGKPRKRARKDAAPAPAPKPPARRRAS